jgi:hypothetical protein
MEAYAMPMETWRDKRRTYIKATVRELREQQLHVVWSKSVKLVLLPIHPTEEAAPPASDTCIIGKRHEGAHLIHSRSKMDSTTLTARVWPDTLSMSNETSLPSNRATLTRRLRLSARGSQYGPSRSTCSTLRETCFSSDILASSAWPFLENSLRICKHVDSQRFARTLVHGLISPSRARPDRNGPRSR